MEVVVLFAKTPVPGGVKTRLLGTLTPTEAAALAGAFLSDLMGTLQLLAISDVRVALPTTDSAETVAPFVGQETVVVPQGAGDLGERLARVTGAEFARGARVVAAVGADHPTLPASLLRRCLEAARAGRSGWIPTEDGGFAAIALPRPLPGLFADVPWSTPQVAEAVRRNARRAGVPLEDCGVWWDVDTPEDLDRLVRELAGSPRGCAATRAVLETLDPPLSARGSHPSPPGDDR